MSTTNSAAHRVRAPSSVHRRARRRIRWSSWITRSHTSRPLPRTILAWIDRREPGAGAAGGTRVRTAGVPRRTAPSGGAGRDGGGRVPGSAGPRRPRHHRGRILGRTVLAGQGACRRARSRSSRRDPRGDPVRLRVRPAGGRDRAVARGPGRSSGGDDGCPQVAGAARPGPRARARSGAARLDET